MEKAAERLTVRFSVDDDYIQIRSLIDHNMGTKRKRDLPRKIDGRFLCYLDERGFIYGVMGLNQNDKLGGLELDYICISDKVSNKEEAFNEMFDIVETFTHDDIYCMCWRKGEHRSTRLHLYLEKKGFECICKARTRCNLATCRCENSKQCLYYIKDCECKHDLYVRRQGK